MQKLQTKAVEAAAGSESAMDALKGLNLEASALVGMTPDKQIAAIADSLKSMGTAAEKNSALVKFFGEEGAQIGKILGGGSSAIDEATKRIDELGASVDRVDAGRIEDMQKAYKDAEKAMSGALQAIAVDIAPVATAFINMFTESTKGSNLLRDGFRVVLDVGVWVAKRVADAWLAVEIIWNTLKYIGSSLGVVILDIADAGVRSAQWIGEKFKQAWDVVTSSFDVMKKALAVGWEALKVPMAMFVQYTAGMLGDMLADVGRAIMRVNLKLGTSMLESGMELRAATGGMVATAKKGFDEATAAASKAADESGAAWSAMFSGVETSGNEFITNMQNTYRDANNADWAELQTKLWKTNYGELIQIAIDTMKQKDKQRTKDLEKEKLAIDEGLRLAQWAAERAAAAREAAAGWKRDKEEQDEEDRFEAEREAKRAARAQARKDKEKADAEELFQSYKSYLDRKAALDIERAEFSSGLFTALYSQTEEFQQLDLDGLRKKKKEYQSYEAEFGKFLGNLAALQQSNDKRMRAIGKVAAKAQIVTSTAVAAMESFKALAGIPVVGPALGAAAAAAAIAAGAIQLANVDKGSIGMGGASSSISADAGAGGVGSSRGPTQTLVVQGDYLTPETLARLFAEAKEKGITIEGVRRA
jgi:hypothetical protein